MAKCSPMMTSPTTCYPLTCLQYVGIFILLSSIIFTTIVSCSKPDISYSTNCASVVPDSTSHDSEFKTIPFPQNQDGFYLGGDEISDLLKPSKFHYKSSGGWKTFLFQSHHVYNTDVDGTYKVVASLILQPEMYYYGNDGSYSYSYSSENALSSFTFEGFWSKSTGRVCMVGSSTSNSPEGRPLVLAAVLKLYEVRSFNKITSLVKGTLDSLSSAEDLSYFKPISLLVFPKMNYEYFEVSKGSDYACQGGIDVPKSESLSLPLSKSVCTMLSWIHLFELGNANGCNFTGSCAPFGDGVGFLPQLMSLSLLQCSDDRQSLRFLLQFPNNDYISYYQSFTPNTSLIAEGSWDPKKNQLCVVACRILSGTNSLNSFHVEDCSIRLSLRFPSVWSIKNANGVVGEIWSIKDANDQGYFNRTMFQSQGSYMHGIPELKYNYTLVDRARKSCSKNPSANKRDQYPDGKLIDMRFDMSVRQNSDKKKVGYGYSEPIFVGDEVSRWSMNSMSWSSLRQEKFQVKAKMNYSSQLNISYRMSLPPFNASPNNLRQVQILAEGIYDAETGELCMVGCRYLDRNNRTSEHASMDCEILIKVQFPPLSSNKYIHGTIESKRQQSAPLYFDTLSFSAVSFPSYYARESIQRMDFEIIMALISNTLVCVFVGCQIFYTRKHLGESVISILMLVVLSLGYMIPLLLNFEALFFTKQNHRTFLRRTSGWLEVNEVLVRLLTMVAFLLQFRLLQIVLSARLANGNAKASWVAEKKTLYVSLPLYIVGGLVALLVNWKKYNFGVHSYEHSLWVDLRSYAGLILDGFLFPQILLNIFHNSREPALSPFFYMGTTFVRLLPHAYDNYRAHYYSDDNDWSYMYANPSADYYSTVWDVIIALGGLLFAAIVHLQQRFGGRCFLPKRFKELEGFDKVPVVTEA